MRIFTTAFVAAHPTAVARGSVQKVIGVSPVPSSCANSSSMAYRPTDHHDIQQANPPSTSRTGHHLRARTARWISTNGPASVAALRAGVAGVTASAGGALRGGLASPSIAGEQRSDAASQSSGPTRQSSTLSLSPSLVPQRVKQRWKAVAESVAAMSSNSSGGNSPSNPARSTPNRDADVPSLTLDGSSLFNSGDSTDPSSSPAPQQPSSFHYQSRQTPRQQQLKPHPDRSDSKSSVDSATTITLSSHSAATSVSRLDLAEPEAETTSGIRREIASGMTTIDDDLYRKYDDAQPPQQQQQYQRNPLQKSATSPPTLATLSPPLLPLSPSTLSNSSSSPPAPPAPFSTCLASSSFSAPTSPTLSASASSPSLSPLFGPLVDAARGLKTRSAAGLARVGRRSATAIGFASDSAGGGFDLGPPAMAMANEGREGKRVRTPPPGPVVMPWDAMGGTKVKSGIVTSPGVARPFSTAVAVAPGAKGHTSRNSSVDLAAASLSTSASVSNSKSGTNGGGYFAGVTPVSASSLPQPQSASTSTATSYHPVASGLPTHAPGTTVPVLLPGYASRKIARDRHPQSWTARDEPEDLEDGEVEFEIYLHGMVLRSQEGLGTRQRLFNQMARQVRLVNERANVFSSTSVFVLTTVLSDLRVAGRTTQNRTQLVFVLSAFFASCNLPTYARIADRSSYADAGDFATAYQAILDRPAVDGRTTVVGRTGGGRN